MARLYETKDEQANRELYAYYAGVDPAPATFPPRIVKSRPRYQTFQQTARKIANQNVKMIKAFRRATGGYTGT